MRPSSASTGTVKPTTSAGTSAPLVLPARSPAHPTGAQAATTTVVRVTIDADDRNSRRVVGSLEGLSGPALRVVVRDARDDPDAARSLERLVCCGPVTPVVEVRGLLLTAPTPAEALLAVRRVTDAV